MISFPLILLVLLAYLLGSIPSSVWIGRWFYKVDVRNEGSGNAGATNTIRVLGWKAGVPVLIMDVFKAWLAVSIIDWFPGSWYNPEYIDFYRIGLAVAAVLGNIFPILAGFRGGKGVATLLGVGLGLYGSLVGFPVGIFLILLLVTGYVSLGSVTAAIAFPFCVYFFSDLSEPYIVLAIFVAIFVPLTHWKNIIRLIKRKENKVRIWKK